MDREADILKTFGEQVRRLRKKTGLSQEAFADKCGLDRTYIGGIERGERNVALKNIFALARGLSISMAQLLKGL